MYRCIVAQRPLYTHTYKVRGWEPLGLDFFGMEVPERVSVDSVGSIGYAYPDSDR